MLNRTEPHQELSVSIFTVPEVNSFGDSTQLPAFARRWAAQASRAEKARRDDDLIGFLSFCSYEVVECSKPVSQLKKFCE